MSNAAANPWDNFSAGGDYVEFNEIGDTTGWCQILSISAKVWDDGKVSPQLGLRRLDDTEVTLTSGWVMLVKELKEKAPGIADWIKVTMTGKGPKPKETRAWDVETSTTAPAGWGAAADPTPAASTAPVAATSAAPITAPPATGNPLDRLTAEEKAALGIVDTPAPPAPPAPPAAPAPPVAKVTAEGYTVASLVAAGWTAEQAVATYPALAA